MTSNDPAEIHFYLDGELGPDEAAAVEERFECDARDMAHFEALLRQKEVIARALESLESLFSGNRQRTGLSEALAAALSRRLAQLSGSPSGQPETTESWSDG